MVSVCGLQAQTDSTVFPIPPVLEPNVRFWVAVFTKYSASEYLFFDAGNVNRIFEIVDMRKQFPAGEPAPKKKEAFLKTEKERIISELNNLGEKDSSGQKLSKKELGLAALFGDSAKPEDFKKAAERVRIQHGNREQFREGLARSGRYLDSLKIIFVRNGLPEELVFLPHVESSFNPHAGSKVGAVGMWQFMGSTGKKFLRIDERVDERRDPYLSSIAAAKLLKLSYDTLKTWPLAITSYNHGLIGIKKIIKELGTRDLGEMVMRFESKPFGFASKNFYAEFLAAVHVARNPSRYFNNITLDSVWRFKTVGLPLELQAGLVKKSFHIPDSILVELNPSLSPSVLNEKRKIPLGYVLRLPVHTDEKAVFEEWVSEGILPRGAYTAWCTGMEKIFFRYVDTIPYYFPRGKDKRG